MARAKIFDHDGSQAVLLPEGFHFDAEEVEIRMQGDRVILEAPRKHVKKTPEEMQAFWARIDAIRGDEVLVLPEQPKLRDPKFDW